MFLVILVSYSLDGDTMLEVSQSTVRRDIIQFQVWPTSQDTTGLF